MSDYSDILHSLTLGPPFCTSMYIRVLTSELTSKLRKYTSIICILGVFNPKILRMTLSQYFSESPRKKTHWVKPSPAQFKIQNHGKQRTQDWRTRVFRMHVSYFHDPNSLLFILSLLLTCQFQFQNTSRMTAEFITWEH